MKPKLETSRIGDNWVVRSPDVPELFVAHRDRATAEASVPAALDMIARMKDRLVARNAVQEWRVARAGA